MKLRRTPLAFVAWSGGWGIYCSAGSIVWLVLGPRDGWQYYDTVVITITAAVVIQWVTGSIRLFPDHLRAGGLFYKRRIPREQVLTVTTGEVSVWRWITDGIVLVTVGDAPDIRLSLSGGLTYDRRIKWLQSIETWLADS